MTPAIVYDLNRETITTLHARGVFLSNGFNGLNGIIIKSVVHWLAAAVLIVAVLTFGRLVVAAVLGSVASDWNGARLAPTFALLSGYHLYYPAHEGPITNHVYGPVAAFAYLPAALFRTPTPAILAGALLQVTFVFGAMLAFVWRAGVRTAERRPPALACGLGACLVMSRYPGTAYWFTMVHADGPSLALGLLACAALDRAAPACHPPEPCSASALAAILSGWAKQTAAPLPIALGAVPVAAPRPRARPRATSRCWPRSGSAVSLRFSPGSGSRCSSTCWRSWAPRMDQAGDRRPGRGDRTLSRRACGRSWRSSPWVCS